MNLYCAPEFSVIVPTLNEVGNVGPLVARLEAALGSISWEILFVDDDSTDGTLPTLRQMAMADSRIRVLHRIGRRGLASAVVEGILATSSPYLAVMDADLQHDEQVLPVMFRALTGGHFDIVVASRYAHGGGVGRWNLKRVFASRFATTLANLVMRVPLSDPMSGYFAITRVAFDRAVRRLSSQGYKILLDLFVSFPGTPRFLEVPYTFRQRHSGKSKLDALVASEYVLLILDKLFGRLVPVRFWLFALVGGLGVGVHFAILWILLRLEGIGFVPAQTGATVVAMAFNFLLNNVFTYRDRRLRGWCLLLGLLSFYVVCSLGLIANVGVGSFVFRRQYSWWTAGAAGALVGAVWNFAATSVFTWHGKQ